MKGFTLDRSEVDSFMALAAICATARRVMGASRSTLPVMSLSLLALER